VKPLVIVPFHDPKWLENTEANLARQSVEARVVLVTNGKAADFVSPRWQTTPSGSSHAEAVNAGVEWARDGRDFTHVVLFDSDDYYGPRYLEKTLKALESADYVGKRSIFVRLQNGEVHLMDRGGLPPVFATVGFKLDRFVPVQNVLNNCKAWTDSMRAQGSLGSITGPEDYCYFRHGANAHWNGEIPDVIVRKVWGPSVHYVGADHTICDAHEGVPSMPRPVPTDAEIFEGLT
jgi:hypothetical protein